VAAGQPDVNVSSSPANPSLSRTAVFAFAGDASTQAFECALDGGGYKACASGQSYSALADGNHAFLVRAIDSSGKRGPAARVVWRVVNAAPIAQAQVLTTTDETPLAITLAAKDDDAVHFSIVSQPVHGQLLGTPPNLTYLPDSDFFGVDAFRFIANDGEIDSAPATISMTVQRGVSHFAAYALNGVSIGQQAVITNGDIGVALRSTEDAPGLSAASSNDDSDFVEVRISQQARLLNANSWVLGDTVEIRQAASVFSVGYNRLLNAGNIQGDKRTPLSLVLLPALPALPAVTPGTRDVMVGKRGSLTLDPGSYGALVVDQQGTLILKPGLYQVKSVNIDQQAKLLMQGATEIRVLGRLTVGQESYVGPAPDATGLSAKQIRIFVAATSKSHSLRAAGDASVSSQSAAPAATVPTGTVAADSGMAVGESKVAQGLVAEQAQDDDSVAVNLDQMSVVIANIVAPNGLIQLGQRGSLTGALLGRWVIVGQQARLTLVSAFEPAHDLTGGRSSSAVAVNPAPAPAAPADGTGDAQTAKPPLANMLYLPMIQR